MKTYNAPSLTTYGDVETITQGSGDRTQTDMDIFNGVPFSVPAPVPGGGSADIKRS